MNQSGLTLLRSETDVHQVLLVDVRLRRAPDADSAFWEPDCEPFRGVIEPSKSFASSDLRRTYVAERAQPVLYGTGRRWHRTMGFPVSHPPAVVPLPTRVDAAVNDLARTDVRVCGVELLSFVPPADQPERCPDALLIVHLLHRGALSTGRTPTVEEMVSTAPTAPIWELVDALIAVEGAGEVCGSGSEPHRRRPFSLVFAAPDPGSRPVDGPEWGDPALEWLWHLASATPVDRYPPSPTDRDRAAEALWLSADWRCLVLSDGAAFGAATQSAFVRDFAPWYFHSIYTDAIALSVIQQRSLHALADRLASIDVDDAVPLGSSVLDLRNRQVLSVLERGLLEFRNRYWWPQLTDRHTHATAIWRAHARQAGTPTLIEQLDAEIDRLNRQLERDELRLANVISERVTGLVAVFTVVAALGLVPAMAALVDGTARIVAVLVLLLVVGTGTWILRDVLHEALMPLRRRR